jgi:hypothetical protein
MQRVGGRKLSLGRYHMGVGRPPYGRWGHPPCLWALSTSSSVGMKWWDPLITLDDGDVGPWIHVTSSFTVERKHTCDLRVEMDSKRLAMDCDTLAGP